MPDKIHTMLTPNDITIPAVKTSQKYPTNAHIPGRKGRTEEPEMTLPRVTVKNFRGIVKMETRPEEVVTALTLNPKASLIKDVCWLYTMVFAAWTIPPGLFNP